MAFIELRGGQTVLFRHALGIFSPPSPHDSVEVRDDRISLSLTGRRQLTSVELSPDEITICRIDNKTSDKKIVSFHSAKNVVTKHRARWVPDYGASEPLEKLESHFPQFLLRHRLKATAAHVTAIVNDVQNGRGPSVAAPLPARRAVAILKWAFG
jgi:hypothetical protein